MKKFALLFLAVAMSLLSLPAASQDKVDTTNKLGMAGDGLDLYAVLDLFQKSKTIEAFEKSLNDPSNKINNLDLNLDKKIDFIKVVTEKKDKKDESYMFVLRVDVSKTESQDVAVILLDRDKDKKVSLQIVGDEDLYGKDYVIEPKGNSPITPNPGYKGEDPVTVTVEPSTTNVVVQQAPIVQYVYSPAYAPYYPPYYYGYYPGYFAFTAVMTFGMYAAFSNHYHGGYYGGHYHGGNNVIINNNNNFNNYNNNRMRSNEVNNNRGNGNYGDNRGANRGDRGGNRNSASTRPANDRGGNRGNNASTRPATSDRSANTDRGGNRGNNASTRPTTSDRSASSRQSSNFSGGGNRSSSGGGGRSMGGGGGFRGGGGGGGRRR